MKIKEQIKAKELRGKGYSLNEISRMLSISKSTASLWLKNIHLSSEARKRINARFTAGQLASQASKRKQTLLKENEAVKLAENILSNFNSSNEINKVLCAMIYYCEGNKIVKDGMRFINSDPLLIATFLRLFRSSFEIEENRLRGCIHLHHYHDKDVQLKFWSKIARIPKHQFIKPYIKQNSGLYKKEGYQGCVSIRYSDTKIARELKTLALEFMKMGL